jgi:hypothetical protein
MEFYRGGFASNSRVKIVIVNEQGNFREEIADASSDGTGQITPFPDSRDVRNPPPLIPGTRALQPLCYAATDLGVRASDLTGVRWTVTGQVVQDA